MTTKCRAWACGCDAGGDAGCPLYCEMCEQFTPICPQCGAVYGEHRPDCTCPDGYEDVGEGPWDTLEEAMTFAETEVGAAAWCVVLGNGRWYVMAKREE